MKFSPILRAAWLFCLAAFLCLGSAGLRAQPKPGIIQITCEPGVLVFLDSELKGETAAEFGGMILRGVTAGQHTLRFAKEGFDPAEGRVNVPAGGVAPFKVEPFTRQVQVKQSGQNAGQQITRKSGQLRIQSLPIECTITIARMQVVRSAKNADLWELDSAPLGEFDIEFEGAGRKLSHRIVIREKALTHLFVDFLEGKIEDRSPPAAPTAEEKAAKLAAEPVAPAVRQRAAPPGEKPLPPREALVRAEAAQKAIEDEIAKIDVALKGGAGLDQLAALVEKRNGREAALAGLKRRSRRRRRRWPMNGTSSSFPTMLSLRRWRTMRRCRPISNGVLGGNS
jgi:hypothetical protein